MINTLLSCYRAYTVVLCTIVLTLTAHSQTRLDMPDGEAVAAVNIVSYGAPASNYRLSATRGIIYSSKLSGTTWSKNKLLFEIPLDRRIVDAALRAGETGDTRAYGVLLDDGKVMLFSFDTKTETLNTTPEIFATPFISQGGNQTYKKLFINAAINVHFSNSVFVNRRDGNGYVLDSSGLSRANVQDLALDNQANLVAATNRGAFSFNMSNSKWSRISGFDSTLSASSIFVARDGRYFVSTSNRGTFTSKDNGATFTQDTVGLSGQSLTRFCDDVSNSVFALSSPTNSTSNLYRKIGAGAGWTRIDSSAHATAGGVIRINDLSADQTLEIGSTIGTMSSVNQADTWSNTTSGIVAEDIYGVQYMPGGSIVVSTSLGVFRKTTSWSQVYPLSGFNGGRALVRANNPSTLCMQLASTGNGSTAAQGPIFSSNDQGATWVIDTVGLSTIPAPSGFGGSVFGIDQNAKKYISVGSPISLFSTNPWQLDTAGFNSITGGTAFGFNLYADLANITYFMGAVYNTGGGNFNIRDIIVNRRAGGSGNWAADTAGLNKAPITTIVTGKPGTYAASGLVGGTSLLFKHGSSSWQSIPAPSTAVSDARALALDSTNALYVAYSSTLSNQSPNRGVYATSNDGATWDYAGLDGSVVRGLFATSDGMYAYSNRGAFKLSRTPLRSASVQFSKHVIDFGLVDVGTKKDTMISISNSGNDTLRVTNLRTQSNSYSASPSAFTVAPGASKDVIISFQPTVGGTISTTMRSVANTTPDTLLLTGQGKAANVKILLEQTDIDMGIVNIGETKDSTISVGNGGGDTLIISNVASINSAITSTPKSFRVAPGEKQDVTIRFAPTITGGVIAFLRFTANGPSDSVRILGRGEVASVDDPRLTDELGLTITPNPTSSSNTTFQYHLPQAQYVRISIINAQAQTQVNLFEGQAESGAHQFMLSDFVNTAESGMYFVRVSTSKGSANLKFVVTK